MKSINNNECGEVGKVVIISLIKVHEVVDLLADYPTHSVACIISSSRYWLLLTVVMIMRIEHLIIMVVIYRLLLVTIW